MMNRATRDRFHQWSRVGWAACLAVLLMSVLFLTLAPAADGAYPPPAPDRDQIHKEVPPPPPPNAGIIRPPAGEQGLPPGGGGGLAQTGAELAPYVGVGLSLVVVGGVVLVATRKRSRVQPPPQRATGPGGF